MDKNIVDTEDLGRTEGMPMGYPTVKVFIDILSELPKDYRVTCCGAENYLYLSEKDKCITIDNERYLC